MDAKLKVPRALKAKVMLWTDVSYHEMEEIDKMQSIPDLESVLCTVLGVDLPEPKRGVLLELYVHTVLYCRECGFKKEQTSALLSIIKSIHEANIEMPLNNLEKCCRYCKDLLLCHSVRRPPFSINLFNSTEVDRIFKYIHNNYMRHHKLYRYIFTPRFELDLCLTYSGIPDHEDPPAAGMEDGTAVVPKKDESPETLEISITDQEETALCTAAELKALMEKEVREQMMLASGRLNRRMKEIADEHSGALDPPQPNHKAKK